MFYGAEVAGVDTYNCISLDGLKTGRQQPAFGAISSNAQTTFSSLICVRAALCRKAQLQNQRHIYALKQKKKRKKIRRPSVS